MDMFGYLVRVIKIDEERRTLEGLFIPPNIIGKVGMIVYSFRNGIYDVKIKKKNFFIFKHEIEIDCEPSNNKYFLTCFWCGNETKSYKYKLTHKCSGRYCPKCLR